MKKNHELFWILEVLLLTPLVMFWMGVLSMTFGSSNLFSAVVGNPLDPLRSILVAVVCPAAAAWFAHLYISDNKKEQSQTKQFAKYILAICVVSIILVIVYLYGENKPR